MSYNSPEQLNSVVEELRQAAAPTRWQIARANGVSQCYYVGIQWIGGGYVNSVPNSTTGRSLAGFRTDMNPDSSRLRTTLNLVTKMIVRAGGATYPSQLYVEGLPPDFDPGIEASFKAQVHETLANMSIDYSSFLAHAQDAQFNRCICGSWGVGFYIRDSVRDVDGQMVPDKCVKSFTFDPVRLILDPAQTARDLEEHEVVIYEDVWTLAKLRRIYGQAIKDERGESKPGLVYIKESEAKTFGDLLAQEIEISQISNGQLYQHYRTHSRTKGTRVVQVHTKGSDGRFGRLDVLVQDGTGKFIPVNFDDPTSPFGGSGMPLGLIHGHRRPGSMWSIGEGQMTKDSQDQVNLAGSLLWRQVQRHGGPKLLVDMRNFPQNTKVEDVASKFSNAVGGIFDYRASGEKNVPPPQYLETPAPQPFIMDLIARAEDHMREQAMRTGGNFGTDAAKSHVPYTTTNRLLEEADQPLGIRVEEDEAAYGRLIRTLVSTNIRLVQEENPGTLAWLREKGFGQEEFMVCLQTNPYELGTELRARGVRFRSLQARKQDLESAMVNKAISPIKYRTEQAELDTPVTSEDRRMFMAIRRKVDRLIRGAPWEAMALGEYNEICLGLLRQAMLDRRVENDPEAKARVQEAVWLQMEAAYHETAMMAAAQAPQQPMAGQQAQAQPQSMTLGDVLSQMEGNGPQGVPAEPAAV